MSNGTDTPIVGFAAFSGTGKTALLTKLLPLLTERGLRVAVIKHAHHGFDIDKPGKDSYELRKAGASQVLVASRRRWALVVEHEPETQPQFATLLQHLELGQLDLVLVEGFKRERFPKIELHRPSLGKPLIFPDDDSIIAIASDAELPQSAKIPVLDINQPQQIADFIQRNLIDGSR
jgi:molybdopterin-guanine dinucleotide biosynthesis protein B